MCIHSARGLVQAVTNQSKVEAGRRKGGEVRTTSASVVGAVSGGHTRQTARDHSPAAGRAPPPLDKVEGRVSVMIMKHAQHGHCFIKMINGN